MTFSSFLRRPLTPYEIRKLVVVLFACAMAVVGAFFAARSAFADGGETSTSTTNQAVAVNTTNGSSIFNLAFQVLSINSDVVAPVNLAYAYSSCTACQTVAVAVQIVFVTNSHASQITPQNYAVAINYQCSSCNTLAAAYQFVVSTPGPVRLTEEGAQQLRMIAAQLQDLRDCGCDILTIHNQLAALMAQLQLILKTDLVPIDHGRNEADVEQHHGEQASVTPSVSPSASPSGSTTESPSPSASPSATPSASPTSTDTAASPTP